MRICLFLSVCLCSFTGLELQAQNVPIVQPASGFRMSDKSPLSRLSTKDNKVTPASFLGGTDTLPPLNRPAEAKQQDIPSILTGKKKTTTQTKGGSEKNRKIDPLNIPSVPIGTPSNSPGAPIGQPSSFVPPANTKSAAVQSSSVQSGGSFAPGSIRGANTGSATQTQTGTNSVQPKGSTPSPIGTASPRIESPSPPKASNNSAANKTAPRIDALQNRAATPTFDQVRTAEARNTSIRPNPPSKSVQPNLFTTQKFSPQIKVTSIGPKSLSVNKSGKYEVKIANLGTIDANEIMVGIEIPAWVEIIGNPVASGGVAEAKTFEGGKGVIWSVSFLPAGRDSSVVLDLMPKENRAFNLKTEWTTAPVSSEAKVLVTQPNLMTSIAGPSDVKYGEKAVYKITIENGGNGAAEKVAVSLSDSLGGDSANVGNIEAGATKQFEVELTAGQAGPLKLQAFVTGDAGVKSEIAKEIVVRRAKLDLIAKGPEFKYAGSAVTYNVTVENKGDAPARNITAASLLPVGAEYISGLTQVTENDGRKIGWTIGEIPANSKREFTLTCLVNQAGEARMEFGVRSVGGLTAADFVTTKVEALADLTLEVVDPRGPQAVGRDIVYELHIKNRGTKAANNIQVSGEFSDNIDPIAGKGAAATIKGDGVITFAPIRIINVGESVILKVVANAKAPGTHTFRAIVECKAQDIRRVSEGTTKFFGDEIQSKPRVARPSSDTPSVDSGSLQPIGQSSPTATSTTSSPTAENGPSLKVPSTPSSSGFVPPSNAGSGNTLPPTNLNPGSGGTFQGGQ